VELLITLIIFPLVTGALAVMLLAIFQSQNSVTNQLSDANDSQAVSAFFVPDVQSASAVTTLNGSTPECAPTGTQLLGLEWTSGVSVTRVVSYARSLKPGSTTIDVLDRYVCSDVNGSLTQLSVATLAYDIPPGQGPATVTCFSGVSSCNANSTWLATTSISSVKLTFTTVQGATAFSLSAIPRDESQSSSGGIGISSMEVLGSSSCTTPALTVTGGGQVNVSNGKGSLIVATSCAGSVNFSHGPSLNAAGIETGNAALAAYVGSGGSPATGPPETYLPNQQNPLSLIIAPSNPSTGATGACSGTPIVCSPGEYSASPSFSNTAVATFGNGSGIFVFDQPLSLTNSMNITFGAGTYWFKGGLYVTGNAAAYFGAGTYIFGNSANNTCPSQGCLAVDHGGVLSSGSNQVLLYNEAGVVSLAGNGAVSLTGSSAYAGVAIWDASASGTTNPLTLANSASSAASYGGVYVPNGEIVLSGAAPVNMNFLIAEYASVSGSGALSLG
jgi:hypothetical protein